jgi:hypothetical protein
VSLFIQLPDETGIRLLFLYFCWVVDNVVIIILLLGFILILYEVLRLHYLIFVLSEILPFVSNNRLRWYSSFIIDRCIILIITNCISNLSQIRVINRLLIVRSSINTRLQVLSSAEITLDFIIDFLFKFVIQLIEWNRLGTVWPLDRYLLWVYTNVFLIFECFLFVIAISYGHVPIVLLLFELTIS